MNDVVVVVSVDRRSDKETGKVGLIRINWELKAAGAAHLNAFAIQLDKVRTSEVAGVETTNTTFGRGAFAGSGPESGSELAVIPLFNTSQEILGEGTYINTTKGVAIPTVKHTTTVTFAQPVDPAAVRESALNAFIVVNQKSSGTFTRETEIHMPGRKPTQFAVVSGNTFLESDPYRYFVTKGDGVKNNYMMWALCIPGEFRYPLERSDIRDVYTSTHGRHRAAGNMWNGIGTKPTKPCSISQRLNMMVEKGRTSQVRPFLCGCPTAGFASLPSCLSRIPTVFSFWVLPAARHYDRKNPRRALSCGDFHCITE